MRLGSLFSGVGGFDLAAQRIGWELAWQVENDPFCSRLLLERFGVPNLGDVTKLRVARVPKCDVLTAGWPCQDLSVAGRRKGLAGERSGLFWYLIRIARRIRPRWLLLENVPRLFSSHRGRDFGIVLSALDELGYGVAWRVLDAQFFGVPQRRRRVFIVGHLGGPCPAEILFEPESVSGDTQAGRETWAGIANSLEASTPSSRQRGDGSDNVIVATLNSGGNDGGFRTEPGEHIVARSLDANYAKGGDHDGRRHIVHSLSAEGADAGEDGTGRGTPICLDAFNQRVTEKVGIIREQHGTNANVIAFRDERGRDSGDRASADKAYPLHAAKGQSEQQIVAFDTTQITSKENRNNPKAGDPCHPLAESAHPPAIAPILRVGGRDKKHRAGDSYDNTPIAFTERSRQDGRNLETSEQAYALTNPASGGRTHSRQLYDGLRPRRLTPRECERLQGFPDDWTLIDGASDSARYRALGNAVAVPVVEWIMGKINSWGHG